MPVAERNKLEPKGPEPDSEEIKEHILLQFLNPSVLRYLICFLGLILLAFCTFILGIQGTYHSAKDTAKQETEESFYNAVFELSETAHHLSNDITIQIQGITEIRNLEVLNVFLTDYQVWPEQETSGGVLDIVVDPLIGDAEAWIRFDGIGIFTVSLQNADFILDEQRKSVLVRVPSPVMERVLIQQDEDDVLYTSDAGLFNNASDTGQQLVLSLTQKAQQDMTAKARSNPEYYAQAKASAEKTITQLIKNLNPDLPDLIVEVEFID